ncbi:hypothetical protein [Tateyamaria sp. syn59]|uniref:hypothetical protein n=1 Tax=Tateyamaria sp. syn59 TaxID=2576942 RepID=UPI0011BF0185|nr:hypothetical protein [Tateyamaria sp. syn59]
MLRVFLNRLGLAPCVIALMLGTLVIAAPIVNAKGGPPRTVFLVLPDIIAPPTVQVRADALGGGRYRLYLDTRNFAFTDICVLEAEAAPIGHAHIHVDGAKVASAFFPVIDIGPLDPGAHHIDVVLRGQDHRALIAQGAMVQGHTRLVVPDRPI